MHYFIRYGEVEHKDTIIDSYQKSGVGEDTQVLSLTQHIPIYLQQGTMPIYTSPSKKCQESAKLLGPKREVIPQLQNISHDFSALLPEKTRSLTEDHLIQVRYNFLYDIYHRLTHNPHSIIWNQLNIIQEIVQSNGSGIYITHGLVLVVFDLYIKKAFDGSFENLLKQININEPFYGPRKGYSL